MTVNVGQRAEFIWIFRVYLSRWVFWVDLGWIFLDGWRFLNGSVGRTMQDLQKLPLVAQWCRMLHDVSLGGALSRSGGCFSGHINHSSVSHTLRCCTAVYGSGGIVAMCCVLRFSLRKQIDSHLAISYRRIVNGNLQIILSLSSKSHHEDTAGEKKKKRKFAEHHGGRNTVADCSPRTPWSTTNSSASQATSLWLVACHVLWPRAKRGLSMVVSRDTKSWF